MRRPRQRRHVGDLGERISRRAADSSIDDLNDRWTVNTLRFWIVMAVTSLGCFALGLVGFLRSIEPSPSAASSTQTKPTTRLLANLDAFPTAAFRTDVLATVTSFEVPSSQHVVRIAMHDLDGAMLPPSVPRRPVPPAIFDANVIYGMFSASPYDILRRHSRLDEDRLNRMYSALRLLGSPLLLNSSFEAMDQTWTARGFLVAFPSDAPDLAMVEHRVVVLARTMEQAHVWKWTSHVWGTSATRHRNAIQEVVPTFAQLESLHAKRPCYDISWRDEAA
ncbi:hypothetical protein, variant 1 [Aphanomyces invadans]|uniref:Uncharacterized protein n=1 Tax=Aphanomyces invadans TaxID=157072 RepID=A0A024UUN1_9STRA|nr:hypothetical protein H310_01724 [Aphanomyces invadans]XP_008863165.1 hypothetical protein, variant 1 [Aphanomyces invadans]ETW09353.1 hypothetical protein H310_01724 [Aphanomyces invadans]ETW09354.1 hypothetical protein, variant 1 [Aphanomyces invadans]|eukprot:XP_008863158.1 hypothetical protein H310_01724 [Aphanomyces invadans]